MTTGSVPPKDDSRGRAIRVATDLRDLLGEVPHTLHAEPGFSGGAPHRPRRPRPGPRHRDEREQTRLSQLYARQLTMRLLRGKSSHEEGVHS
jgi:hypothetical protein